MKRILLTAAIATMCFVQQGISQGGGINIGLHASPTLPIGDAAAGLDFGFGGGLSVDYYFNNRFNIGLEGEYISIPGSAGGSLTLIPLQLTGAFHADLGDLLDFYAGTGVGLFMQDAGGGSTSDLGITPRVGLAYALGDLWFIDFNIRYGHVFSGEEVTILGTTVETPDFTYLGFNLGLLYTIEFGD